MKTTNKNIKKDIEKLQKLHSRLSNIRTEYIRYIINSLVKQSPKFISIEDLNVKGMLKNRKLARAISDMGFYEFKRQLIYKAKQHGKSVLSVGRFFPSSKMCSCCGELNQYLTLSAREWKCLVCQTIQNRDVNASINILRYADKDLITA